VVRFRAEVAWQGGQPTRETLLAATTSSGPPPGTIPVVAATDAGELAVGVWRWPFDPALPRLETLLRARGVRALLAGAGLVPDDAPVELRVRAYRPTNRVVMQVDADGRTWYLKVLRSDRAAHVERLHRRLSRHGLPVPQVAASDVDAGWLLFDELPGPTLRELIKADDPVWIEPSALHALVTDIASLAPDEFAPTRRRLREAPSHAELLARVIPTEEVRLRRLADRFREASASAAGRGPVVVHGDLHEAQLVVASGRITGVLDVDEFGLGDPIDDAAVAIGHLQHRATHTTTNPGRIVGFADDLASEFADEHGREALAVGVAAVLMGIAGAPFRSQRDGWQVDVAHGLDRVEQMLPDP
jgi:aminoglycoside phosphotransferase (APT) family kinase protein